MKTIQHEKTHRRVSSASRFGVSFSGKYQSGFTLIEMMVVMSVIALMMTLMAWSMISAGKQVRLRDAAKTLQSNIRKAANNSISVAPDPNNPNEPAKAWAIALSGTGFKNSYNIVDYYGNTTPVAGVSCAPNDGAFKLEYTKSQIPLESGITVKAETGYLVYNLTFSSPFAKFAAGGLNGSQMPDGVRNIYWCRDKESGEFTPVSGLDTSGSLDIDLTDGTNTIKVRVNTETGESSIVQ